MQKKQEKERGPLAPQLLLIHDRAFSKELRPREKLPAKKKQTFFDTIAPITRRPKRMRSFTVSYFFCARERRKPRHELCANDRAERWGEKTSLENEP